MCDLHPFKIGLQIQGERKAMSIRVKIRKNSRNTTFQEG